MADLKDLFKNLRAEDAKAAPRPCPKCGERDAGGPCHGVGYETMDGPEFDCETLVPQECDTCFYIWCFECKTKLVDELGMSPAQEGKDGTQSGARGSQTDEGQPVQPRGHPVGGLPEPSNG